MFYLFILEGLGTSELMVILVIALVVFGPRRLPDLGRKLGKYLGEFRRASEDFKRTWETEVNMESATDTSENAPEVTRRELLEQTSIPVQTTSSAPETDAASSQQSIKLNQVATASTAAVAPNNFTLNASDDVLHTNDYARIAALGAETAETNASVETSNKEDASAAISTADAATVNAEATTAHGETVVRSARTTASDRVLPLS